MNQTAITLLVDPRCWDETTAALRSAAAKLLSDGTVAAVVGYIKGRRAGSALPAIVTTAEEAAKLIFSPACTNNLSLYLTRAKKEVVAKGKLAVMVKGCDLRAIAGLISENQLSRDKVVILGLACPGVYAATADRSQPLTAENIAAKCCECSVRQPGNVDQLLGTLPEIPPLEAERSRGAGAPGSADPAGALGLLERPLQPLHPLPRLPPGLPFLLLRTVPLRSQSSAGGRRLTPARRQHCLAHRPRHAPRRPLRRLRRMRERLPDGNPLESPQPQDGAGAQGVVRF